MKQFIKAMLVSCAVLSGLAGADINPAFAQLTETFTKPMIKGHRLDLCLHWGRECGQAAAEAWCAKKFGKADGHAVAWKIDPDIGASSPTYIMGDDTLCKENFCDGFQFITCEFSAD